MPDQDDTGPTGPVQPPGYDDISIEFVETADGDDHPPKTPFSADLKEPETGILEISVEPEEHEPEGRALELETQVAKLEDQILRRRADFENYRRRQDREREELSRQTTGRVVEALLPALDDLDRAVDAVRQEVSEDHLQGLLLVRRQIFETLGKLGVEEIDALGQPFDPAFHEAVCMAARPDVPPMTVTSVFQKGYTLGGKLLKAARVEVNGGAPAGEQGAADV
jgi:molecular chaperone GrpE